MYGAPPCTIAIATTSPMTDLLCLRMVNEFMITCRPGMHHNDINDIEFKVHANTHNTYSGVTM